MKNILLSIIIPGKNDTDYCGSFDRLRLNLTKTLDNVKRYDDVEVILCDWGSDVPILNELNLKTSDTFKCVYVNPDIAKKYNKEANYSIVHPINTAFRHSSGRYVIFWDTDCFITSVDFDKLIEFVRRMDSESDKSFYWGSRFHIPFDFHSDKKDFVDIDQYLASNGLANLAHDKISVNNFMGTGISLLMARELWESSTGFWEELSYWGWQDIELHRRLCSRYKFSGDLEDNGIIFFHLQHHGVTNILQKPHNPQNNSSRFDANGDIWGLNNEHVDLL